MRYFMTKFWNEATDVIMRSYKAVITDEGVDEYCSEIAKRLGKKNFCWQELTALQPTQLEVARFLVADQNVEAYFGNLIDLNNSRAIDLFNEVLCDYITADRRLLAWAQLLFWDEATHLVSVLVDTQLEPEALLKRKFLSKYTLGKCYRYPNGMLDNFLSMVPTKLKDKAVFLYEVNPLAYIIALCPYDNQIQNDTFIEELKLNDFKWGNVQFNTLGSTSYIPYTLV